MDCRAVSSEQLAFFKDEIIVVTASNDTHWWVSATTTFTPLPIAIVELQCEGTSKIIMSLQKPLTCAKFVL